MSRFAENLRAGLSDGLVNYPKSGIALPGIGDAANRNALVGQLIESLRRNEFVVRLRTTKIADARCDPNSKIFDPIRAAAYLYRRGDVDEAFWLVFLATHFGKHLKDGWQLVRDVYRGGDGGAWTFARFGNNPEAFSEWLSGKYEEWSGDGITRKFGNHRKYETLRTDSARGTNVVLRSYVGWIGANRGHAGFLTDAEGVVGADPNALFDFLYHSMAEVQSFGRTARFDYLTMLGKLGLAAIEPGIPYLIGATGPLRGARLLFGGSPTADLAAKDLNNEVAMLGKALGFGMQAAEDALCNWQKSPSKFVAFRG